MRRIGIKSTFSKLLWPFLQPRSTSFPTRMTCLCNTTSLRIFLRNLTQINLRPNAHYAPPNPFVLSTQQLSIFRPFSLQHSSSARKSVAKSPVGFCVDKGPSPLHPSSSLEPSTSMKPNRRSTTLAPSSKALSNNGEPASFVMGNDLTNAAGAITDAHFHKIDALASKSRREIVHRGYINAKKTSPLRRNPFLKRPIYVAKKDNIPFQRSNITSRLHSKKDSDDEESYPTSKREPWQAQKAALKDKFQDGWNPRKRLSPDALAGIRAIHAQFPTQYSTSVLAEKFQVSPESIRRILKSKWTPKEDEELDRQRRWFSRGQKVWIRYAELGLRPPQKWRSLGIGKSGGGMA